MKLILLLLVVCSLLGFGCGLMSAEKQVEDFIPGKYVTEWTTDFTEGRDTMLIEPAVEGGSQTYQVTRRTYMLYRDKPQYKLVHWVGVFNGNDKTIAINNNGRILSFDVKAKEMKMGTTVYKKL